VLKKSPGNIYTPARTHLPPGEGDGANGQDARDEDGQFFGDGGEGEGEARQDG